MSEDDRKGDPRQTLQELFAAVGQLDDGDRERVRDGLAQLIEAADRSPKAQLHKTIRARWLEQADRIIRALQPTVRIELDRGGMLPHLGGSRVGGVPGLPAGTTWPRSRSGAPLAFVAQIALAELSDLDGAVGLPDTGRLVLFCDHAPEALATRQPEHLLIYDTAEERHLEPLDWPDVLDDADGVFVEAGLGFDQAWALPPDALPPGLQADVEQLLARGVGRIGGPFCDAVGDQILLLDLETFDVVRVPGTSESSFGQGRLRLLISADDLAGRAFERASLRYQP
jgi:hypothetical protein